MMDWNLLFKILGAIILFAVTFFFTILPYKLKRVREGKLKSITSFCGGLFLGLSFLHLLPDTLRGFQGNPKLKKVQEKYPFAELVILLGMILVLAAEKLASIVQIKNGKNKKRCTSSENCCQETCKVQAVDEKTPLARKIEKSYVEEKDAVEEREESGTVFEEKAGKNLVPASASPTKSITMSNENGITLSTDDDSLDGSSFDEERKYQRAKSITSITSISKKKAIRLMKIRTICLVIALMVHSLFEGLTVGLQTTSTSILVLVSLLTFHKCLVGFSLGIALVNDRSDLKSFQKKAALFAVSSPIGVIIGIILFSTNLGILSGDATSVLTALATGTFLYVTFFEILGKSIEGHKPQDMIAFASFLVGFGLFAGITAIPAMQH